MKLLALALWTTTTIALSVLLAGCGGGGTSPTSGPNVKIIAPATVSVRQSVALQATVTDLLNTHITWDVLEDDGGTITADGVYTAPQTPGIYHVTATCMVTVTDTVAINVQAATGTVTIN